MDHKLPSRPLKKQLFWGLRVTEGLVALCLASVTRPSLQWL